MAFQTKDFVSVVAGALNHMRASTDKITDFRIGSVARTIIEGPAVEIEQFYQQMFIGLREAIPVATFLSFGFVSIPAARAQGIINLTRSAPSSSDLTIPQGTTFKSGDGRSYSSTATVVWLAASLAVEVPVQSDVSGLSGNTPAGTITQSDFLSAQSFESTVSNLPLTNGRDDETDAEREARFADFIQSLSRGTVVSLKYAARQAQVVSASGVLNEYVSRVGMVETPGRVRIYIYSSLGAPSADLIEDGQRRIDGWTDEDTGLVVPGYRAAGVQVEVLPMAETEVPFSVQVAMLPGYALNASVTNAMIDIFTETLSEVESGSTFFVGALIERLLAVPGVRRVVPGDSANIICGQNEVLAPGTFSVAALND